MKLLCLCSALDLRYRFGCTPAWWQFLKGLHEEGHDVIAIPYLGAAFETPWWRSYPNPCDLESRAFSAVKKWFGSGPTSTEEGVGAKVSRALIESWVRPRWTDRISGILATERDIDAVIVFTIPLNHFTGLPALIRERYGVPFFYFDGDVPASLPRYGGFASGFNSYEGADPGEYDGFMCNSEAGAEELRTMGARDVHTVHWGMDPALYEPLSVKQDRDVFFYGYGVEYREASFGSMLIEPSRAAADIVFFLGGTGFPDDVGGATAIGDVTFNVLRQACSRARINLNISRSTHADVRGSSTMRPFELAAMGCCIVSNPHDGMETWFAPDTEICVVYSAEEALDTYRTLLHDEDRRRAMGRAARQKVLSAHTHRHRAREIVEYVRHCAAARG
jgi:glycosyltransferase involved in cell wall biosynthesis